MSSGHGQRSGPQAASRASSAHTHHPADSTAHQLEEVPSPHGMSNATRKIAIELSLLIGVLQ